MISTATSLARTATILSVVSFMLSCTVLGRETHQDVLSPIAAAHRQPVMDVLARYTEYQLTQQWGPLYDLFSPELVKEKKDKFIEMQSSAHESGEQIVMLDFVPRKVYVNEPFDGRYEIYGCASVVWKGRDEVSNTIIEIEFEGGEWRVSHVGAFVTCMPEELKCKE